MISASVSFMIKEILPRSQQKIMDISWIAILILGIVQGFTEVFPISSSAHLILYGKVLGYEISFGKILFLHLATFLGILIYYWKDMVSILAGNLGKKVVLYIFLSFTTTAVVGLLLEKTIVSLIAKPDTVAQLLIINGLILAVASLIPTSGTRSISQLSLYDFIFIGLLQGLAGFPGISRLGLTIIGCSIRRMKWPEAIKLSFILSLPTILAANVYRAFEYSAGGSINWYSVSSLSGYAWVNLVSFGITFGACLWGIYLLSKTIYLGRRLLSFFGIYCAITGFFFWQFLLLI